MTRPTRHHAARMQDARPGAGLPEPGQALIGYPEPPPSLFGVPQPGPTRFAGRSWPDTGSDAGGSAPRPRTPPRPRPSLDDHPAGPHPRRNWPQVLGFPLAVLLLGVALGVIAVVMLVAAGVPAPWAMEPAPRPHTSTVPPASTIATQSRVPVATRVTADGVYLIGTELKPGRYVTAGGPACHWARLQDRAGIRATVAEGNGPDRTVLQIRKADVAFQTSGCTPWTRR